MCKASHLFSYQGGGGGGGGGIICAYQAFPQQGLENS